MTKQYKKITKMRKFNLFMTLSFIIIKMLCKLFWIIEMCTLNLNLKVHVDHCETHY